MKVRFPLYAQILLWFFLNLVFLAVAFYAFFKVQFRLGLDSLLMSHAGEHINAVSAVIADELGEADPEQWSPVLKRFSDAYHVQFSLFRDDGSQLAGPSLELPQTVRAKLLERSGPFPPNAPGARMSSSVEPRPPFDRMQMGPGDGPPRPRPGQPPSWRDEPAGEPGMHAPIGPAGEGPGSPGFRSFLREQFGAPRPRFMLHTSHPSRYWVLVRMRVREPARPRPAPATLIAMSNTMSGGGLFLDFGLWPWVGFGVVFVSVLFWLPLVRGITRSISQMSRATESIAEGQFDVPVPSTRKDELGRLGQSIGAMAARLSGFVHGQKRFLGDIAHELCSPIARMQVALGILEERADPKQRAYVEDVREEVQHMSSLVNELLSFSKAGLMKKEIQLQSVAVEELARKVVNREAAEDQIKIAIDPALRVLAEPELLSRALANLLRNALRYAGAAGPVSVSATAADRRVVIAVADQGPGVPEEMLGRIFDPFFRLEASRSRETGGIGLGLAIVKTCVETCQGTVSATNRKPNGLEVRIVLKESQEGRI